MTGCLSHHHELSSVPDGLASKCVTTFITYRETHLPQMSTGIRPYLNERDQALLSFFAFRFLPAFFAGKVYAVGYGVVEERRVNFVVEEVDPPQTPPCTADSTGHGIKPGWDQR